MCTLNTTAQGGTYHSGNHYTPLVKKQGVSKNGTPKIPITSVLTPASIRANVVSSTLFGTSQQTIPSYFTSPISVPSGVSEFICPSGVKVNLPSSQDLNSLPGNVSGMGPNNTNLNCGGGGIYNSPCSFLTSNQKRSDQNVMQSHSQDHCRATLFVRSQQSAEKSTSQIQKKNGANVFGTSASGTDSFNTNSSEISSQ